MRYKTYLNNYLLKIKGKHVWVKFNKDCILVGNIEPCSDIIIFKIISILKKIAFVLSLSHIRFQCSSKTYWTSFLKTNCKEIMNNPIAGIIFDSEIDISKFQFTMSDNDTF